jgi:hypothetical protein
LNVETSGGGSDEKVIDVCTRAAHSLSVADEAVNALNWVLIGFHRSAYAIRVAQLTLAKNVVAADASSKSLVGECGAGDVSM